MTDVENLAWKTLRLVIEGYDDCGIVLHGRVYNQDQNIKLDFVSPYDLVHFGQTIPKDMLETEYDAIAFAETICEMRIPEYYREVSKVKPPDADISTYRETFSE